MHEHKTCLESFKQYKFFYQDIYNKFMSLIPSKTDPIDQIVMYILLSSGFYVHWFWKEILSCLMYKLHFEKK